MIDELQMAYGGNWWYLILLCAGSVFGLVFLRSWKKALVVPGLVLTAVVLNPVFCALWNRVIGRSYWRTLWTLLVIPVVAMVPAYVTERANRAWLRVLAVVMAGAAMIVGGDMVYNHPLTTFTERANVDKLPGDAVDVADALLALDDEPRVVADYALAVYIRQYSGKIKSLYGRSVAVEVTNPRAAYAVYNQLQDEDGDYNIVAREMLNNDYEYLATDVTDRDKRRRLEDAGFVLLEQVDQYGIFRVTGKRTAMLTYNDMHQVIDEVYIDEHGQKCNNAEGYAEIVYRYDDINLPAWEYYYDRDGQMLERGTGFLHDFLDFYVGRDVTLFVVAQDEASSQYTRLIRREFNRIGLRTDLYEKYGYSYFAVASGRSVREAVGPEALRYAGSIDGQAFELVSAGCLAGGQSSILIDGREYSVNGRGLNIAVRDNATGEVIDTIAFDTSAFGLPTTRRATVAKG